MSVFTPVSADELSAWLECYDTGSLVSHDGVAAGIENTNYFVTTSQGRFVLTLFEKLTLAELPFYLGLMDHLADRGVPSAKPVRDRNGDLLGELNGKPAALVRFLAGCDIAEPTAEHCARVGGVLADIHRAGESYQSRMDNPRGPRWWKSVMPEILPFLGAEDAALYREEVRFQALYRFEDLPLGPIHADLFRDNVLWEDGRLSGVIDFYFACTDRLLYDVAIAVNDWCVEPGGTLDPARTRALLEAYRRVRPFTAIERGAWPVMLRAAALRFWVSRLYDFYLPRAGELTHAKDPNHFRRILSSHVAREHDLPQLAY
jgi:homoserine kinase type II